jgi:ribonuclease HI
MFKVEYQYSQWKGREGKNGSWWVEGDRTFKSKAARTKYINQMNKKYEFIEFRPKDKEYPEDEEIVEVVMKKIVVYTDGSAHWKDKLGGIGIYMKYGEHSNLVSKGYSNTTNNRMELRAVIETLKLIKDKSFKVDIYSDSELVVNTFTSWIFKWEKDNWVDRKNVDLLKEGLEEYNKFPKGNITLHWVKGHNGVEGNEIADMLAGEARAGGKYIKCQ